MLPRIGGLEAFGTGAVGGMKIAIIYNKTEYVWCRQFFIHSLLGAGHEVVVMAPADEWKDRVEGLGVRHVCPGALCV